MADRELAIRATGSSSSESIVIKTCLHRVSLLVLSCYSFFSYGQFRLNKKNFRLLICISLLFVSFLLLSSSALCYECRACWFEPRTTAHRPEQTCCPWFLNFVPLFIFLPLHENRAWRLRTTEPSLARTEGRVM